jgi:hypothetical protein
LRFWSITDLRRDYVTEGSFSTGHQKGGSAELAVDNLGLFQKIDIPAALRAMNQDPDFGIRVGFDRAHGCFPEKEN